MKYIKPKREHEDNLKAQLYKWTNRSGLHLHFEYRHENSRFDAVFVREGEILAIIEIKNWTPSQALKAKRKPTKQLRKYLSFGPPVLVVWSWKGTRGLVSTLKKIADSFDNSRRLPKTRLSFYPKPKKPAQKDELTLLIEEQAKDMKFGHLAKTRRA